MTRAERQRKVRSPHRYQGDFSKVEIIGLRLPAIDVLDLSADLAAALRVHIAELRGRALREGRAMPDILLKAGAPITYVAAQLGHTKPTTTLRFYPKYLPEETQRFVDRLDACEPFDQARPQSAAGLAAKAAERGKTATK